MGEKPFRQAGRRIFRDHARRQEQIREGQDFVADL
jgi:hypothetical protein